jgi:hypothetical protein
VLYAAPNEIKVLPGQVNLVEINYVDPVPGSRASVSLIAGSEVAPLANTDYKATFTQGSGGNDANTQFSFTLGVYSKSCIFNLTSTAVADMWVYPCQMRGHIIRQYAAQSSTFFDTAPNYVLYGRHKLNYSMYYQNDVNYGKKMADYWASLYHLPSIFPYDPHVDFIANSSDTLMDAAIARDIGDRITITEEVTGIDTDFIIIGVNMTVKNGSALYMRYYLEPVLPGNA